MKTSDFLLPFLVSAGIHAGLLTAGLSSDGAQPVPEDTPACVVLNLVPPAASEAAEEIQAPAISPEQPPRALPHRVTPEPPAPPTETVKPPEPIAPPVEVEETPVEEEPEADEATLTDAREPVTAPEPSGATGPSASSTRLASAPLGLSAPGGPSPALRPSPPAPSPGKPTVVPPPPPAAPDPVEPRPPAPEETDESDEAGPTDPDGDPDAGGPTVAAQVLGVSKPRYPGLSRRRSEEGRVVLAVEIRADGSRGDIRIVQSSGHSRLDQAGVQALKRAKFIPATRGGKPVASTKQVAFTFRLVDAGG